MNYLKANNINSKKMPSNRICLMHDWFIYNSLGGSEKVTELIFKILTKKFNTPDIYAITENIKNTNYDFFKGNKIRTTFIQKLPFGKSKVQHYLPIIPFAIEQLNFDEYNLVISSSHAFAKGILTNPDQLHISYIHTPMRYAWDQMNIYLKKSQLSQYGFEFLIRYFLYRLRSWDYISSSRPDYLIANSSFTSKRIKKYWGIDSKIIYPPVNIKAFSYSSNRDDFYLSVCRLVPNKGVEIIVEAFNKLNLPLLIVGDGPERNFLKKIARPNIKIMGRLEDTQIKNLMAKCRCFLYSGVEDFGIAPVEAMASGAPVIAYAKGGILDTVKCLNKINKGEYATGILFKNQSSDDLYQLVNWFEEKQLWKKFDPQLINNHSSKFSIETFKCDFENFIENAVFKFNKNRNYNNI